MSMLKTCKLAVIIPIFDETPGMLLRPLQSLVRQKGVEFQDFEAVFAINNAKADAVNKSPAFFANQQTIKILNYLSGQSSVAFPIEAEKFRVDLEEIRDSGLQIRVIDKSTEAKAEIQNTVGLARNFAGNEVCRSFLTQTAVKENGILVSTDCDCRFSENYVSGIINSFANYQLISLSGSLELEADPAQTFGSDVLTATKLHLNWHLIKPAGAQISFYSQDDGEKLNRLATVNIAVTVKAWLAAGGVPSMHSLEDLFFCKKIFGLPGNFAKSPEFSVSILNRISHRAGALSLGRRVGVINLAVEEYRKGNNQKMLVPDILWLSRFYLMLTRAIELKSLNAELLKWLMEENHFKNLGDIKVRELEFVAGLIQSISRKSKTPDYVGIENIFVKHLFAFLPQKDIAEEFNNPSGRILDKV